MTAVPKKYAHGTIATTALFLQFYSSDVGGVNDEDNFIVKFSNDEMNILLHCLI